jgi:hypothetical protein
MTIMKLLSRKTTVLMLLFLLALVPLTPSKAQTNDTFFTENFDGTSLDAAKWTVSENTNQSGYPAYGGSVKLTDGSLTLSSNGSSFPFIYSSVNPFPETGDFEIEISMQYTCIGDLGCGIMLSNGAPSLDANWHNYKIITIWAHDQGPETTIIFIQFFNSTVYQIPVPGFKPSSPEHIYKITYIDGTYNIYVDSIFVGKAESQQRPNMIVLGNPPNPDVPRSPTGPTGMEEWGYWGWSSFKINYISVNSQTDNNDNSEQNGSLLPTQISLSTNAETEQLGYKIRVFGNLVYNEQPIENGRIVLFVSMPGVQVWQPITSTTTNSEGVYSASWIPTATGEFTLRAEYSGDVKFAKSFETKNISITESEDETVFFVESNSTLSSLAFNSTSYEMSFTVNGATGTKGYVRFTVSKELISDPTALNVYLDGSQLEYTVTDLTSTCELYFVYTHSQHTILIAMPQPLNSGLTFTTVIFIIVSTSLAAIGVSSIIFFKKRKSQIG